MNITIDNGWSGPVEGVARFAAATFKGEAGEVAMRRGDLIAAPRAGQKLQLGEIALEVIGRAESERGILAFRCKRIATEQSEQGA